MLLFKIFLAPVLIGLVSLAGRKWGPGISGWLLGLPLNSGPILLFLVLQEGRQFAAAAAGGTLLGIIPWAAFGLVYAYCSARLPWWWSMLAGWAAYTLVALLVLRLHLSLLWSFAMVVAALAAMLMVFPRPVYSDLQPPRRKYDLWLRMITATAMVVTLTAVAKALGPLRSGILSAFPAYTTILAVFNHQHNAASAVMVLRGVTMGLFTAATFFLVLSTSLTRTGSVLSFSLALAAAGVVQAGSLVLVRRQRM